jgi:hypothetical protein
MKRSWHKASVQYSILNKNGKDILILYLWLLYFWFIKSFPKVGSNARHPYPQGRYSSLHFQTVCILGISGVHFGAVESFALLDCHTAYIGYQLDLLGQSVGPIFEDKAG